MTATAAGRLLAVDWGDRRVGLAVSDELGLLASPAGCIVRRAGKRPPLAELERRAEALEAAGFVFGLPLDQAGEETPRSAEVRAVAATLAARQPRPVRLVDERFTTAAALRAIREQGGEHPRPARGRGRAGGQHPAGAGAARRLAGGVAGGTGDARRGGVVRAA